jgi:hypothetical protein
MEIQGIGANPLIQSIMSQLQSLSQSAQEQETSTSSLLNASATMQLSGPGRMMAGLQQAYESDPEQFAATLNSLADQLEAAAEKATDSAEKTRMTEMAEQFRTVAETGDVSQLKPPPPPGMGPGKGGGMGGPMEAYAQNESQSLKSLIDYLAENEDSATMDMDTLLQRVDDLIAQLIGGDDSQNKA